MLFCLKYCSIKSLLLFLSLFFFSLTMKAQNDTLPDPPKEEVTPGEGYKEEQAPGPTIYFSEKRLQANDGNFDSLRTRKLPDSIIKKLQADEDFWYVNYPFKKKKEEEKQEEHIPFTQTSLFQTILWVVIIGGFAAFIMIYLSNSNIGLFRKANKAITPDDEQYVETDNIFEINYQREIDKAVANRNYRLAVRLMFLRVLKNLSDKKIIQYTQDRTNFDYLLQLHSTKYYTDFFRVTRNYEYAWYGQFEIEPEKFAIIKNDFENFGHNLSNR